MGINQFVMYLYLILYFIIYTKPSRTKRTIKVVGVLFPILLMLILVVSVMNFVLYGKSHCKERKYGAAAILSTT